jgi:hypothetical protein
MPVFYDWFEEVIRRRRWKKSVGYASVDFAKLLVTLLYPDQQIPVRYVVTDATDATPFRDIAAAKWRKIDFTAILDGDYFRGALIRNGTDACSTIASARSATDTSHRANASSSADAGPADTTTNTDICGEGLSCKHEGCQAAIHHRPLHQGPP